MLFIKFLVKLLSLFSPAVAFAALVMAGIVPWSQDGSTKALSCKSVA